MSNIEVTEIAALTAMAYDIPWQCLLLPIRIGPCQKPGSSLRRYNDAIPVAAALARTHTRAVPETIGQVLGHRDRTAIVHCTKKLFRWREVDKKLDAIMNEIEGVIDGIHEARCEQDGDCGEIATQSYRQGVTRLCSVFARGNSEMVSLRWRGPDGEVAPQVESLDTVKSAAERLALPDLKPGQRRWVYQLDLFMLFEQTGCISSESSSWNAVSASPHIINGVPA
jgi:hypothetical protein